MPTAGAAAVPRAAPGATSLMPAALGAAACAAAAYLAATAPGPATTRLRRLAAGPVAPAPGAVPAVAAVLLVAVCLGPAAAVAVALAAVGWRAAARRHAQRATVRATASAIPEVCRAVAAELRAGAPPATALARAADDAPRLLAEHLRRLAAATQLGPPPPPEAWAALPGAERLRSVAALWHVAAGAGAGLAGGLDRLAEALAADERQRAEVAAQLAGPNASAVVLAALPLCGLALAASLGARPLAFLLGTPVGLACAVTGAALDATGLWWVRRLTARASP
jgi:tight adherence protein B